MDLHVSTDGSNVAGEFMTHIHEKIGASGDGYVLINVGLSNEQISTARRFLWRSLADHHRELDTENPMPPSNTYGIGKVDCLHESCLELQVLPCFRKIFGNILGEDPDALVCTMDVPQYVPPGQEQSYMGLSIGSTTVVGLLCLTRQFVTKSKRVAAAGTLFLYNAKTVQSKGMPILPENPAEDSHPWLGLRIGFWKASADKYGETNKPSRTLRRELFLQGRFGLHFDQSPYARPAEIVERRKKFVHANRASRFFAPDTSGSVSVSIPHARQLYFDTEKKSLKWVTPRAARKYHYVNFVSCQVVPESHLEEDKENKMPSNEAVTRDTLNSMCREMISPEIISPLPPTPSKILGKRKLSTRSCLKLLKTDEGQRDTKTLPLANVENDLTLETTKRKRVRFQVDNKENNEAITRDTLADMCREMIQAEPLSPLPPTPSHKLGKRKLSTKSRVPKKLPKIDEDRQSEAKRLPLAQVDDNLPLETANKFPLTELLYDSMYEDSGDSFSVVSIEDCPPCRPTQSMVDSIPFDTNVSFVKCANNEGDGVLKRVMVHQPPGLAAYIFQVDRAANIGNSETTVCFCSFQSMPDKVYEVRGAKNLYQMLRALICGYNSVVCQGFIKQPSWFTVSEYYGQDLSTIACKDKHLYKIERFAHPVSTLQNCYFNIAEHERKKALALPDWTELTAAVEKLKRIEWDDRAKQHLGEVVNEVEDNFPQVLARELNSCNETLMQSIANKIREICTKETRAPREAPVAQHLLSEEQVLEKHQDGVKHLFRLCKDWMDSDLEDATVRTQIQRIIRGQLQLIEQMKNDAGMRLAYQICGLSSTDMFVEVICTRLEGFKLLVNELKSEIKSMEE